MLMYLRRQALWHFLENREEFEDMVVKGIKDEYGLVEDDAIEERVGPFSVYGWVKHMSNDKVEGDGIMILLIASMWGCRISIVRSDCCKEVRFRHEKKLDCSDFILLYNCCPGNDGHYSAVMHTDKMMITGGGDSEKI